MRIFMAQILLSVGLLAFPGTVSARQYFVDSASGDDGNSGGSGSPLNTIREALFRCAEGDSVRIRSGLSYNERRLLVGVKGVTLSNWGAGKPTIVGDYLNPGSSPEFPAGTTDPEKNDILRIAADDVRVLRIRFVDADFAGIAVRNGSGPKFENIEVKGCETFNTGSSGMLFDGCDELNVQENTIEKAVMSKAEECLTLKRCTNFDINRNTITNRPQSDDLSQSGGEGIDIKVGCQTGVVRGNRVTDIEEKFGIYVDGWLEGVSDVEIFNNFVRNSGGISIASEQGGLCLLYTSPSPRDKRQSRMPSSA